MLDNPPLKAIVDLGNVPVTNNMLGFPSIQHQKKRRRQKRKEEKEEKLKVQIVNRKNIETDTKSTIGTTSRNCD